MIIGPRKDIKNKKKKNMFCKVIVNKSKYIVHNEMQNKKNNYALSLMFSSETNLVNI